MPAAEDKVVLQVSIQIQDAMKRLGKIEEGVQKVKKIAEGITPGTGKKDQQAIKQREQVDKKSEVAAKARRGEAEKKISALKKQTAELIKQEKILNRISKKVEASAKQFGQQGWKQRAGGAVGALLNAPFSLAGGLYGFMMGGLKSGYAAYQQYGMSRFGLTGLGARGAMRGAGRRGLRLGFGLPETMQQAAMVGRRTGAAGAVNLAQQFAFAGGFGTDVGGAAQVMGQLREAGLRFGLGRNYRGRPGTAQFKADRREDERIRSRSERTMREMVAAGMYTGLEKAKLPEFYQSVAGIAQDVSTRQFGQADIRGISTMLASFAKGLGISAQRASKVMGAIDQGIRAPGAGEAGQALIMQAFGFGKPGGQTGFYEAMKQQQRGLFGGPPGSGAERLQKVFDEINRQYGTVGGGGTAKEQEAANYAISQVMPQLTLDQIEKIQDMVNSGQSQEERMAKINKILEEAKPIDQQALQASKEGFAGMAKFLKGIEASSIKIGGKAAATFQYLQKVQMKALDKLTDYFPQMIAYLKEIASGIMALVKYWGASKFLGGAEGAVKGAKMLAPIPGKKKFSELQNIIDERRKRVERAQRELISAPAKDIKSMFSRGAFDILASGIVRGIMGSEKSDKEKVQSLQKELNKEHARALSLGSILQSSETYLRRRYGKEYGETEVTEEQTQMMLQAARRGAAGGKGISPAEIFKPPRGKSKKRGKMPEKSEVGPQASLMPRTDTSEARSRTSFALKNPYMSGEPGAATSGSVGSART